MNVQTRIDGALTRTAAVVADKVRNGLRSSFDVDALVNAVIDAYPDDTKLGSVEARSFVKLHVVFDNKVLGDALDRVYLTGWVLGVDMANHLAGQHYVSKALDTAAMLDALRIDWAKWKPGNKPAAALLRQPRGLQRLLDRRGIMLKGLNDTTVVRVGTVIANSLGRGLSAQQLAKLLRENIGRELSDPLRANTIAVTEMSRAMNVAATETYKDMGVEFTQWLALEPCDACQENADSDPVPMGDAFPSGDFEPPAHPNCRCQIEAVFPVLDEAQSDAFAGVVVGGIEVGAKPDLVKRVVLELGSFIVKDFDPEQERDDGGRWTSTGSGGESSNGSATNPKIDAVTKKVQEKTKSLISQSATFDRMMNEKQQLSDYNQLLELGAMVDPEMSPEEGIQMETGWQMTAEAINYGNADQTLSGDEGNVYAMHDSAGQLAGAIAYSIVNDGDSEVVEIHYLGTTGAVDGAGSALFGNAASWAADKGMGLALTWLDSDAQSFWQNMGFDKREDEQNSRLLFMSANDTAQIARGING